MDHQSPARVEERHALGAEEHHPRTLHHPVLRRASAHDGFQRPALLAAEEDRPRRGRAR
jgi:hypothetical protein